MDNMKKQSLDEFLSERGLSSPISEFLTDKLKGNRQLKTIQGENRFYKEATIAREEYHSKREVAIDEYKRLVKDGKIIPKTRIEISLDIAKGFYENDSVQAARRMCLKRNKNWLSGKELIIDKEKINMLQMTHNEFHEYQEKLASKIWNQELEYNVTDFINDTKKVHVIDYDLDKYNIPGEIKILINEYMKTNEVYENHETFFGRIDLDNTHYMAKLFHCEYGIPFGYAGYYRNNDYMIIISYAEGDFNVSLYTDKKEYNNAVIKTHNFYETEKFYEKNGNVWTKSELNSIEHKNILVDKSLQINNSKESSNKKSCELEKNIF
ncbi:hypothetical protein [Thomasclavelia cocleata]|uniref:hypothetical protein n=1 Tax=Thomasclavelia cocleata TaxID=69824 RepID=UPI00242C5D63|nr:hypothetical protein [Thomasclavelia cocleata]